MTAMPAGFIGHGSPMNTLDHNRYTEAGRAFGHAVPAPRAVLVVSAHWYTNATVVTAMPRPRTIHDFYDFPDELFVFDYPARGAPDVAELVVETVKPRWVGPRHRQLGPRPRHLVGARPHVPCRGSPCRAALDNALQPLDYHLDIGARLTALRDEGVLVIGSGNVVHNLRHIAWDDPTGGFDWARRFDDAARDQSVTSGRFARATGSHSTPLTCTNVVGLRGFEPPTS